MKKRNLYILSFAIPFGVMMLLFIINDIFPFGERSFLHIDMYHQYFPFLTEFYHKIKNGESLFYSWNTGVGTNFLALFVYYLATPTNWLSLICPEKYLMEFISYMVVVKIGLCGLTFTHYARCHFNTDTPYILIFSTFYALSGFMAAYNWNVMWLDTVVLAPIIILGLEELVNKGTYKLYCLSLALSIFSCFYISIMLCIFLVLYFFVLLISSDPKSKDVSKDILGIHNFYAKAVIRFGVFSLLAGGMAAMLILPEVAALQFSEFTEFNFPDDMKSYFPILDVLARHSFNVVVETGLDHWPNIYCGVGVFIFVPLYAMLNKVSLRERASKLILLGFMVVSFATNTLAWLWHGCNYPNSLPSRQSYLYIFLILVVSLEAFLHLKEYTRTQISATLLGVGIFMLLCEKLVTDDAFENNAFLFTALFLVVYGGFMLVYKSKSALTKAMSVTLVLITVLEAGLNTGLTSVPTVSRTTYLSNYDSYQTLTTRTEESEDDFFRFEKFARRTQNDAMLIGFQSASNFSSTSNVLIKDFYEKYGLQSSKVYYNYNGATPVTSALLSIRYMLYTLDRGYDNMYELADTEGNLFMYKANYTLPVGYMITSDFAPEADNLFRYAYELDDELHDESYSEYDYLNPIERQNMLTSTLGVTEPVFTEVAFEDYGESATISVSTSGHYYAYSDNTSVDDIEMSGDCDDKTFSDIKKDYILDLGYQEEGDVINLTATNDKDLDLSVYLIEEDALAQFIENLSSNTMTVDSYDSTSLQGHINVENAGHLVLSVAYEPGWTLYVDGNEVEIEMFEDMFISTYLTEGEHTITISYYPENFTMGLVISILCIAIFVLLIISEKSKKSPTSKKK